jgi:flagellar biosynthetic protein FliQ
MSTVEVLEIGRDAIFVLLKVGAPIMLIALLVGLTISLAQALTQIQEMTLAFVPKILVIFVTMIFLSPFMLNTLVVFTQQLTNRIAGLG